MRRHRLAPFPVGSALAACRSAAPAQGLQGLRGSWLDEQNRAAALELLALVSPEGCESAGMTARDQALASPLR